MTSLLERKKFDVIEIQQAPCKRQPTSSPPSLVIKADKTRHRNAVCDGQPKTIFVDTSSGCPSGSTTAMTDHLYPQHGVTNVAPRSWPRGRREGPQLAQRRVGIYVGVLRAGTVIDQGKSGTNQGSVYPFSE